MESNYLLPHKFKKIGWILFIIGLISGLFVFIKEYETDILTFNVFSIYNESFFGKNDGFFKVVENSILDELIAIAIIIGGLLVGFSKEKVEDEFIYKLRKDSLVWAIIFNYLVLLFAIIFIYDFTFFDVLVFNMFTPLIFFIVRFNVLKRRLNHE
jgi:hypothetical protein